MAGFISGFRAGRSDELQRQQLKSQDQALRYKMGIDAENRMFKYAKEARDQATFQNKNDKEIMRRALTRISLGEELDMTEDIAGAAKRTGYYSILAEEPNQLIADISVANTNLGKFVSGEYTEQEAWTPEVERVMNLAFADRLNLVEGQSRNGRPIVERKVMGVRPAINPETGEMRMEGNDPILNVMIAVKDQKGGDWLTNEDGTLSTFPLTEFGTADDNDQLEPIRLSSVVDRINGIDQTAKFKKLNPEEAKTLMSALGGSGGVTTNVYNTKSAEAEFRGSMVGNIGADVKTAIESGMQANKDLNSLSQSLELLNSIETEGYSKILGRGGDFLKESLKLAKRFGYEVDDSVIASLEGFFTAQGEMTLSYVQGTKGAVSEKEMALFEKMSIGLGRSMGGNRLLITIKARAAELNRRFGRMATDFRRRSLLPEGDPNRVGPQDWDRMVQEFQNDPNNSLGEALNPEVIDQIVDGTMLVYAKNEDPKYGDVGVYDLFITMPNGAVRPATQTQIDDVLKKKAKNENEKYQ